MKDEEIFGIFRETHALLSGHFQLRSGLHSDQFFQCALVLQHPRIAEKLCKAVVAKFRAERAHSLKVDGVISPALGGIPVGHEVGRALGVRAIFAEKDDGKLVLRRAFEVKPGEHFVVAEDVITRGGRVQEAVDIVRERGGVVEAVCVLVNRSGGRAEFGVPLYSLLEWEPNTWKPDDCPLCAEGRPIDRPGSK